MQTLHPKLFAVAICAISLCTFGAIEAGAAGRYVALGDSNATGTGLGTVTSTPAYCVRTANSYPEFVAAALAFSSFASAACNGAGVPEFTSPQPMPSGPAADPQYSALNGSESLVTITIGDNDAGYGTFVDTCLKSSNTSTNPCTTAYVSGSGNAMVNNVNAVIPNRLASAIDGVHQRSPHAEVWVIGYARLIPADGANCAGKVDVSVADAPVFDAWQQAINNVERSITEDHDAYYLDVYTASVGHDGCQNNTAARWANPGDAATPPGQSSFHPTLAGHQAITQLFVDAYNSPRPIHPAKTGPGTTPIGQTLSIKFAARKVRAVSSKLPPITSAAPSRNGAKLSVTLARTGTVEFFIDRAKQGHVKNGKCRPLSKRASKGRKACTRYVSLTSSATLSLPGGASNVYFTGRAKGKQLSAGKYRLRAVLGSLSARTKTFTLSH